MRRLLAVVRHPAAIGLYFGVSFVILFQFLYDRRVFSWSLISAGLRVTLEPGDLATLLSGAVTAASLAAVYVQISRAEKDAIERARGDEKTTEERARTEKRVFAARASELQAVYYSPAMIRARVQADVCLLDLSRDSVALGEMVRYWIDPNFGCLPSRLGRASEAHGVSVREGAEALTMMVGFYVRVAHHLDAHLDLSPNEQVGVLELLGWHSWRRFGLAAFAECCRCYRMEESSKVGTYFVERLKVLETKYVALKKLKPHEQKTGVRVLALPPGCWHAANNDYAAPYA